MMLASSWSMILWLWLGLSCSAANYEAGVPFRRLGRGKRGKKAPSRKNKMKRKRRMMKKRLQGQNHSGKKRRPIPTQYPHTVAPVRHSAATHKPSTSAPVAMTQTASPVSTSTTVPGPATPIPSSRPTTSAPFTQPLTPAPTPDATTAGTAKNATTAEYLLYPDPNDNRLLQITTEDNVTIVIFGEKDGSGTATKTTSISVHKEEGDSFAKIELDGAGRLSRILAFDGTQIEIQYNDANPRLIVINYVLPDGSYRLYKDINLDTLSQQRVLKRWRHREFLSSLSSVGGNGVKSAAYNKTPRSTPPGVVKQSGCKRKLQTEMGSAQVSLSACGSPLEGAAVDLLVDLLDETKTSIGSTDVYEMTDVGGGIYKVDFALGVFTDSTDENIEVECNAAVRSMVDLCQDGVLTSSEQESVCDDIAEELDALAASDTLYSSIFDACQEAFSGIAEVCNATTPGEVCTNIQTLPPFEVSFVNLSPVATIAKVNIGVSSHKMLEASSLVGETVEMIGVLEDDPAVVALVQVPTIPAPRQEYTATAHYICAKESVDFSVVGTDGYSDHIQCSPSEATNTCTLVVPGAAAEGVEDTLTLVLDQETQSTIQFSFAFPVPTVAPTMNPTNSPTTQQPTMNPTNNPTTSQPTVSPTNSPTTQPPTMNPTNNPTTVSPTNDPTTPPTMSPTNSPTTPSPAITPRTALPSSLAPIGPTTAPVPETSAPVSTVTALPSTPAPNGPTTAPVPETSAPALVGSTLPATPAPIGPVPVTSAPVGPTPTAEPR